MEVVVFENKVFRIKQYQYVNSGYTSEGAHWYTKEQLEEFGKKALAGKLEKIEDGIAEKKYDKDAEGYILEKTDKEGLKSWI